ncbi:hypothetical protein [Pararhodobacter sp.]|uniref:hypothetical protein n=1 Tax=Pararhodobacter sp. TaxID=2127056 RepID=UPI002AFDEBFF|nr:hypothetical protein [Pararhodobacter sp.]
MPEQIALIETPVFETTGEPGPRVLHDLCKFELLGTLCRVHVSADGDTLDLSIGKRRFAVSVLDIAATAALSVEAHLRGEIRARIIASRDVPKANINADADDALFVHHFGSHPRTH